MINYCWDCCSQFAEAWETLLHYDCVKMCTQITRSHEKTLREQQGVEIPKPWDPKPGDAVEYKAPSQKDFWKSKITGVNHDPELDIKLVDVETSYANGMVEKYKVTFPDSKLRKQEEVEI